MSTKTDFIERLVWTSAQDFESETGGFALLRTDLKEMMALFNIETMADFLDAIYNRSVELGKNLEIKIEQRTLDPNAYISWKPLPKETDGR